MNNVDGHEDHILYFILYTLNDVDGHEDHTLYFILYTLNDVDGHEDHTDSLQPHGALASADMRL